VHFRLGAKVIEYDLDTPSLILDDGSKHTADLIVAADGIKSQARKAILGARDRPPEPAGFAAYRATVPAEKMRSDPGLSWLLEKSGLHCWIGHMRHVMSYFIAGGNSFNMVLSHPETSDPSTWKQDTALADMRKHFQGWDPRLVKIINMIESTMKWPLLTGYPLDRWISSSGKVLIIGDAAHAMVPYMSEGAAMAVEDGVALATVVSAMSSVELLSDALKVFEQVRRKRTAQMQHASLINGRIWHYADGPTQQARDEAMRPEVEGKPFLESPNQWSDPVTSHWCYAYDAEVEMLDAWNEHLAISRSGICDYW